MAKKQSKIPQKYQHWVEARKKYKLSHCQIQMARELGMNPKKFGSIANYKQEPWKTPLPNFIEDCYGKGLFHLGSTTTYKWVIFIPN